MQRTTTRDSGWRAALTATLLTFGWILLFLVSILSPLLPSLLAPTGLTQILGTGVPRGGPTADLRQTLEEAARATHQIGTLSTEALKKNQRVPGSFITGLFTRSQVVAGVLVYRNDGTLLEAYYPDGANPSLRSPPLFEMRAILRGARQGAWIFPPDADRGALLYYVTPLQTRGQPRTIAVGIVTSSSLREYASRIAHDNAQEPSLLYFERRSGRPFAWRPALAGAALSIGLLGLGAAVLARRTRRSVDALVKLTRAYGDRRFSEPCPDSMPRGLEPLRAALLEMAEKLLHGDKELIRRERMEGALSRFFPPSQAAEIADGQRPLNLNGQRRVISVVFVHVAGYSAYLKSAPPTEIVALLQEVFSLVSEICFRQGGVMDKSVGDCMVALFGAHELQADHAQRALAAAEDIARFVKANAPRWKQEHAFDVELAIGVSSGEAIVGDIGSETGIEYTAVGEVVSRAAQLAAMARPSQILVSHDVTDHLPTPMGFELSPISDQPLWGSGAANQVLELA